MAEYDSTVKLGVDVEVNKSSLSTAVQTVSKAVNDINKNKNTKTDPLKADYEDMIELYKRARSEYNGLKDSISQDNKALQVSIKDTSSQMQNMFDYLKTVKLSGLYSGIPQAVQDIDSLLAKEQEYLDMSKNLAKMSGGKGLETDIEYQLKHIEQLEKQIADLTVKREEYLSFGGKSNSKSYIRMGAQLESLKSELLATKSDIADLYTDFGVKVGTANDEAFSQIYQRFQTNMNRLTNLTRSLSSGISDYSVQTEKPLVGTKELSSVEKDMTKVDTLSSKANSLYTQMQDVYTKFQSVAEFSDEATRNRLATLTTSMQGLGELTSQLQSLSQVKPSSEYIETLKQYETAVKGINALKGKQSDYLAMGGKDTDSKYIAFSKSLALVESKAKAAATALVQLRDSGQGGLDQSGVSKFNSLYQALTQRIDAMKSINTELSGSLKTATDAQNVQLSAEAQAEKQKEVDYNNRVAQYTKLGNAVGKVAKGTTNMATSMIRNSYAGKKASKAFNKLKGIFTGSGAEMEKMSTKLTKLVKRVVLLGLGFRSTMMIFRKLRSAIVSSYKEMAGVSDTLNQSISNVKSSFKWLTDSLAAGFEPLINYFAPMISALIDRLAQAASALGHFFATLTGQKYVITATKVQQNYAESMSETAEKADDMLGAYDKLNVIGKDDSGGSGSGTPAFGMGELETESAASKFAELVKQSWASADFTEVGIIIGQKLNQALNSIPWNDIRNTASKLGSSIATGFNGLFIGIDWDLVGHTIAQGLNTAIDFAFNLVTKFDFKNAGKSLGEMITAFFRDVEWGKLAQTITAGIKGKFDFITSLVEGTDWVLVGQSIGEFMKEIDWSEIIKSALEAIGSIAEALAIVWKESAEVAPLETLLVTLFGLVNYTPVGAVIGKKLIGSLAKSLAGGEVITAISTALGSAFSGGIALMGMDLSMIGAATAGEIAVAIGTTFLSALAAAFIGFNLGEFIYEVITGEEVNTGDMFAYLWDALFTTGDAWTYLFDWFKDIMGACWDGIKAGVDAVLNNGFVQWWLEVWWTFIDVILGMFGIHSPSTVFFDIAKNILLGLRDGLVATWHIISDWWHDTWEKIKSKFSEVKQGFVDTFGGIKDFIKGAVNGIIGFVEGMVNSIISGINTMSGALNSVKLDIPDWVPVFGGKQFGFNIPTLSNVSIPRLATGAVIPANAPFLAMLGDQRKGTNIEAPLDTIKQAVAEVVGNGGHEPIVLQVSGKVLAKVVWDENEKRYKQTGNPSYA